jgi:rhodanese-related sulfurtransferase
MAEAHRCFSDRIYEQFARIGKAVSAAKRLELLDLLAQGPRTVESLASHAGLSVANASRHLQVLRAARLVEGEKRGLYVEYRLADSRVSRFWLALRGLAEARLSEVEEISRQYLEERGTLEPVGGEELLRRVRSGEVTVLDVRPAEEYRAGHVPGARSIPLAELEKRLAELPRNREVVAYCRGPYCALALEAVELLREHGFRARRMEHGVLEWRARGWRVETGDSGACARAVSRAQ